MAIGVPVRVPSMKVYIHEENAGALILAMNLTRNSRLVVIMMQPRQFGFIRISMKGRLCY